MSKRKTRGIAVWPDKRMAEVELTGLADYQAIVGGYIEAVTLSVDGSTMYVNEEYRYQFGAEDVNWAASDIAAASGLLGFLFDPILGPVVIVGPVDDEGYDTDINPRIERLVRRVASEAGVVEVNS